MNERGRCKCASCVHESYNQELKNSRIKVSSLESRRFAPDTSYIFPQPSALRHQPSILVWVAFIA